MERKNFVFYWSILQHAYIIQAFQRQTLWTILSKCFHNGIFRLICCRLWQVQCSSFVPFSQISFHWNCLFLTTQKNNQQTTHPSKKKKKPPENQNHFLYRKPARKVFVDATEVNLIQLFSSSIWIYLSNSTDKPELGILVTSFKWVAFSFSKMFVL